MGRRGTLMSVEGLCRFLAYMLGRRPDEFGLVPAEDGRVSLKELLQALHEEEGWRHVRQAHINELLMGPGRSRFDLAGGSIAAADRLFHPPAPTPPGALPKLLYTAVRPRAHAVAMEKGLSPPEGTWVVLTASRSMAIRIGRRKAPEPVIVEIGTAPARAGGVSFFSFGDLFLAGFLPHECLIGPQAPPEPVAPPARKPSKTAPGTDSSPRRRAFAPGSFTLTPERDPDRSRASKGRKPRSWKEKARAGRKLDKE